MGFLYEYMVGEQGRIFPEVKPIQLFKLPIRSIDRANSQEARAHDRIERLVMDVITANQRLLKSQREAERVAQREATRRLEASIDQEVYALYDLAPEDVEAIDSRFRGASDAAN
jgi:adenine-specific DNA-methyltransferase